MNDCKGSIADSLLAIPRPYSVKASTRRYHGNAAGGCVRRHLLSSRILGAQGDNARPVHRKKQLLVCSGLHRRRIGIAVPYHHNHCMEADGEHQVSTDLTIVFFRSETTIPPPLPCRENNLDKSNTYHTLGKQKHVFVFRLASLG